MGRNGQSMVPRKPAQNMSVDPLLVNGGQSTAPPVNPAPARAPAAAPVAPVAPQSAPPMMSVQPGPWAPGTPEFAAMPQAPDLMSMVDYAAALPPMGNVSAPGPISPLAQFESAMQTGSDYLSRGIGALTSPINTVVGAAMKPVGTLMESALSPVNAVLAGLGGSSLGQAGGGFADAVSSYNAAKAPMPEQRMVAPPGVQNVDYSNLSPDLLQQLIDQLTAQLANIQQPPAQTPQVGLGGPPR